jgi:hypothetical protein
MRLFWYNSKDADQNGTSSDKDGAKYHPWGEDITEQETGEEGIPEKGYSA